MVRKFRTLKEQILLGKFLFNTDPANPGGGGTPPAPADPSAAFTRLLEKHNQDGVRLASTLFDDNWKQREEIRQLKARIPEGSVVLTGDEVKDWNAFKALNVEMKDVKTALKELPDLKKQNAELASMENYRELAEIGLDGKKLKVSVLKDLLSKFPDAQFRFVTEKAQDGKTDVRKAYIKPAADGQETDFAAFTAQNLTDYLPSLKVDAGAATQPAPNGAGPDPAPDGNSTSFFDGIRKSVEEKNKAETAVVNPLTRFGREGVASQG
jgi:hypothetical protein